MPSRAEPSRAEPSRAEPSRAEPSRALLAAPLLALFLAGLVPEAVAEVQVNCPGPRTGDKYIASEDHTYGLGCLDVIVSAASAAEGDSGTASYYFAVRSLIAPGLKHRPHAEYFEYDVSLGGTATKGEDYEFWVGNPALSGKKAPKNFQGLLFDSSTTTEGAGDQGVGEAYYIRVMGDDALEPDETITFTITYREPNFGGQADYQIGKASATFTIRDDDTPVVSIAGGAVTEGGNASFTLTASPAPTSLILVAIDVAQSGSFFAHGHIGRRIVGIGTGGTATYAVANVGDEPNGSVKVTLAAGQGYAVHSSDNAASVTVNDDGGAGQTSLPGTATTTPSTCVAPSSGDHWNPVRGKPVTGGVGKVRKRIKATFEGTDTLTRTGVCEIARQNVTDRLFGSSGPWCGPKGHTTNWEAAYTELDRLETCRAAPAATAVTLTAGSAVTEGTDAVFTVSRTGATTSALTVDLSVAEAANGDFVASDDEGAKSVTIPAGSSSADYSVTTQGDTTDEPNGSVTVTLASGSGYTVGSPSSASVSVNDDDATSVTLVAPSADVVKGAATTLTVTLGRALVSGESLAVPLVFGGAATLGTDYALAEPATKPAGASYANLASTDAAKPPTLTFTGPSASSATLVLTAAADTTSEGEGVTVALGTLKATGLGGGATGTGTGAFAVAGPPPGVSIAAKSASVTEGTVAGFTLTATPAPATPLDVSVTVAQSGDYAASGATGTKTVRIPVSGSAAFTVATVDDAANEVDGSVTATLGAGSGYIVAAAPANAATVLVKDNDAAATVPTLSLADATHSEDARRVEIPVTATFGRSVEGNAEVTILFADETARQSSDYLPVGTPEIYFYEKEMKAHIAANPGKDRLTMTKNVVVYILPDWHDEGSETFTVSLAGLKNATAGKGSATITIRNSDPMPAAFLSRFGRTVAQQAVDGIAARIAAPRAAGMIGALAGQAIGFGTGADGDPMPGASGADREAALAMASIARGFGGHDDGSGLADDGFGAPRSRTMTAREALLGSSFSLTGESDTSGGSLAFWGRAGLGSFDGREGTLALDGEVTTGMLGTDYARGKWLLGLALARSEGEGGYGDTAAEPLLCARMDEDPEICEGAVRAGNGTVEASLTAVIPYAALQASERLKLWSAAGYGTGEVTLKTAMGGSYEADTEWSMAAAGVRSELLQPPDDAGGTALALVSDALWTRTSSEKTRELAASESDTTRLRLGLEGRWHVALESGGSLVPKLEVGARHDGGAAETGAGVELGGGMVWTAPTLGLTLDLAGRMLLAHADEDFESRGFAGSLAFDPDPATTRGPAVTLRQQMGGPATGGVEALFAPTPLSRQGTGGGGPNRWTVEAAYGLPAFDGRLTSRPSVGLGLAPGTRDYSLGWRLEPGRPDASALTLGLTATRLERDAGLPEHRLAVDLDVRW